MKKLKKSDWFLLIFLIILIVLTILFSIFPEWGVYFNLSEWVDKDNTNYDFRTGIYIVAFACFLGALVPFPVPYTAVVALVALKYHEANLGIGPLLLMIIVATITNSFGDFFDWLIGRGGGYAAEKSAAKEMKNTSETVEKSDEKLNGNSNENPNEYDNKWAKIVYTKPALIPALLILFGLTPLPDSILFMPLGVIKYPLKKTMLWNTIGKLLMMIVCTIAGIYVFDWFFSILGGGGTSENGWISGMVLLFVSWLIMALMLKKK